jgi:hypothetical protein
VVEPLHNADKVEGWREGEREGGREGGRAWGKGRKSEQIGGSSVLEGKEHASREG